MVQQKPTKGSKDLLRHERVYPAGWKKANVNRRKEKTESTSYRTTQKSKD